MQVLILTNKTNIAEDIAKVISYTFPECIVEACGMNKNFPAKSYDLAFILYENGWEEQSNKIVKVSNEVYLVTEGEVDITILNTYQNYGIKKVVSKSALTIDGPETKLLAKKYKRAGYLVRDIVGSSEDTQDVKPQKPNTEESRKDFKETETYISKFPSLIIGVFGSKGGTGKTTFSISLAAALAKVCQKKVGVIDLDTKNKGSLTNKLSMRYSKTIGDFIDGLEYEKANDVLVYHKDGGFFVLPGLMDDAEAELITIDVVDRIIRFAVSVLDIVILDLSATMEAPTLRSLELCDVAYIVSDTCPDAFDNIESLQLWPEIYMKMRLVVNNAYLEYKKDYSYRIEKIEETKGIKFLTFIRNDRSVNHSWNRQEVPLLNRKCKVFREDFKTVVQDINPYIGNKLMQGTHGKIESRKGIFSFLTKK